MSSITAKLASALGSIHRPGEFAISGKVDLFMPKLDVDGVGRIALPLLPFQAEELIALAERDPFGRGEETVIDTDVRRTWQLASDQVQIGGKHWQQTLDHILDKVANGLGVTDPIEAVLAVGQLQLTDSEHGLDDVFSNVVGLAAECRFADCGHQSEPGCAVLAAIECGELDPNRLKRYRKLVAENAKNQASLAERRSNDRAFGKMVKGAMKAKRSRQRGSDEPLR